MTNSAIFVGFFILISLNAINSKPIYATQLYSHGASYPTKDAYDYNQTKNKNGALTSIGMRQQYLLGSYLQNDYVITDKPLFNRTLHPRQIEFFSLNIESCLKSAYSHALGLFPYGEGEKLPENIDEKLLQPPFETLFPSELRSQQQNTDGFALDKGFQPMPVYYAYDFFPDCPNYNVILSDRGKVVAKDLAQFQLQQSAFTSKMRLLFNLSLADSNLAGLQKLANVIMADKYLGRSFPDKFTEDDYQQLYFIHAYLTANLQAGDVSRILNVPVIETLISNIQKASKGQLDVKRLSTYSVEQSNIVPLLTYYNITSAECLKKKFQKKTVTTNCADPIPFASNLIFELHQSEEKADQFYVKVRYNGVYYKIFNQPQIEVQLSQFIQKSRQNLLDFKSNCKVKASHKENYVQQ